MQVQGTATPRSTAPLGMSSLEPDSSWGAEIPSLIVGLISPNFGSPKVNDLPNLRKSLRFPLLSGGKDQGGIRIRSRERLPKISLNRGD